MGSLQLEKQPVFEELLTQKHIPSNSSVILSHWLSWEACCAYSTKKPPRYLIIFVVD